MNVMVVEEERSRGLGMNSHPGFSVYVSFGPWVGLASRRLPRSYTVALGFVTVSILAYDIEGAIDELHLSKTADEVRIAKLRRQGKERADLIRLWARSLHMSSGRPLEESMLDSVSPAFRAPLDRVGARPLVQAVLSDLGLIPRAASE